jgi:hypothetical protein
VTRFSFRLELLLDDDLRRDAGVVGAHLPQRVAAEHAVIADQHVHDGLLERVTHVQRTRDVGRRQLDAIGRRAGLEAWLEIAARFPDRIPLLLDRVRLEALGKFHVGGPHKRPKA